MAEELLPCPFCGGPAERYTSAVGRGFENRQVNCRSCGASAFDLKWQERVAGPHPMTTPVDIDKLKELLAKVGWTRLHTDYIDQDYDDPQREGWRIHDIPPPHGDPKRPEVAHFIVDGIEDEDEARLIVAAVNSLAALIAKAERVDAMTRALERLGDPMAFTVEGCTPHPEITARVTYARNALSPKPEDAAS